MKPLPNFLLERTRRLPPSYSSGVMDGAPLSATLFGLGHMGLKWITMKNFIYAVISMLVLFGVVYVLRDLLKWGIFPSVILASVLAGATGTILSTRRAKKQGRSAPPGQTSHIDS